MTFIHKYINSNLIVLRKIKPEPPLKGSVGKGTGSSAEDIFISTFYFVDINCHNFGMCLYLISLNNFINEFFPCHVLSY